MGRDTKVNGVKKLNRNTDTGLKFGETGQCTKDFGKMIRLMVGED